MHSCLSYNLETEFRLAKLLQTGELQLEVWEGPRRLSSQHSSQPRFAIKMLHSRPLSDGDPDLERGVDMCISMGLKS